MIRGYEAGEHVPGPRNRMLYAAAFDMAEEDLFGGDAHVFGPVRRPPASVADVRITIYVC
jgi:hypothetical protein